MFNLLTFAASLAIIAGLAKLNRSNKMFWAFAVSMLLGYAGGSIFSSVKNYSKKKVGIIQVSPMQAPVHADSAYIYGETGCTAGTTSVAYSTIAYAKPAGQGNVDRDMVSTRTLQAFNPENDIGNKTIVDTS